MTCEHNAHPGERARTMMSLVLAGCLVSLIVTSTVQAAGQQWTDWIDRGGVVTSAPGVAAWGANRLDVFARGQNGNMWHLVWDGSQWMNWEDLGGPIVSDPACVSWGPNRIDCFARGPQDHVWQKAWMEGVARTINHSQDPSKWEVCRDAFCLTPEWVSVQYARTQNLLVCSSTRTNDAPIVVEGVVYTSDIAGEDDMADHHTKDWCAKIEPDHDYQSCLGRCNAESNVETMTDVTGDEIPAHKAKLIEMEWESGYLPDPFRPVIGDRAWIMGRWVFDLGHTPDNTEIHPPQAVAFTRQDKTAPRETTYVYVYGKGTGLIEEPVSSSYYSVAKYNLNAFAVDYHFDIYAPPRPTAQARLVATVTDKPFGGPDPILTPDPDNGKIHVTYPLASSIRGNPGSRFGVVILTQWEEAKQPPH
jgi:hypothetical protein